MSFIIRHAALVLAVLGVALGGTTPALAQPTEIEISPDQDWQHRWTSMQFPARIDEFEREKVFEFEDRETNVSANYWDEKTETILSIYIYRPGNPEVAIWFDRALYSIGARDVLGTVDIDDMKVGNFVPSGGTVAAGQYAVIRVDGNFRSTAVSLYRAGEWLVKLRISSRRLSVSKMDALVRKTLSGMPPLDGVASELAYFVEECDTPLSFSQSLPFNDPKGDMALALEASLAAIPVGSAEAGDTTPARYCREGPQQQQVSIYRKGGSPDSYFVAVGDSGSGFSVFPLPLYGAEPGGESAVSVHRVQSASGLAVSIHRPFIGMPTIQEAADAVYRQPSLARVSRPLGNEEAKVEINSPRSSGK